MFQMSGVRGGSAARTVALLGAMSLALAGCGGGGGGESIGTLSAGMRIYSMSTPRAAHALTTLANGDLLISGGVGAAGSPLASCDAIDASLEPTGNPVVPTDAMAFARTRHTATLLVSGNVVAIGGAATGATEEYTPNLAAPALGTWTTSATAVLATPRSRHASVRLLDGRVLVTGGANVGGNAIATCELYVGSGSPMGVAAPMGTARKDHTATLLPDGRVLVAGGRDAADAVLPSVEVYDPVTNTWSTPASTLTVARALHTATLLGSITADPTDDRVLIAGGFSSLGIGISEAELFDPATDTLATGGTLEGPGVFDHATVTLANGQAAILGGFVTGGATSSDDPVRETILYRLGAGEGVGAQDMPGYRAAGRAGVVASSGPAGSDVVFTGGFAEDGLVHGEVFLIPIDDEAKALADTLTDGEALAFATLATTFHLFQDELDGDGDIDLAVQEDPVAGRIVEGWVGDWHVYLELDAGSVVGDVETKTFVMTNDGGFLHAPDFDVDFRPSTYVDGDMDASGQDFDFFITREIGEFFGYVSGEWMESHMRVVVDGDHTDVVESFLEVYFY